MTCDHAVTKSKSIQPQGADSSVHHQCFQTGAFHECITPTYSECAGNKNSSNELRCQKNVNVQ